MAGLADAARRLMFGLSETKRTAADLQSGLDAPSLENPTGALHFSQRPPDPDGLLPPTRLLGSRAGWWELTEVGTQAFWAIVILVVLAGYTRRRSPHRSRKAGVDMVRYVLCFLVCYQWYWVTRTGLKVPASSSAAHQWVRWQCINSLKGGKYVGDNDDWGRGWRDCAEGQGAVCSYQEPCTPCNGRLFPQWALRDQRYACMPCAEGAKAGDAAVKCAAELEAGTGRFLGPFCNFTCTSDEATLNAANAGSSYGTFGGVQNAACATALTLTSRGVPVDPDKPDGPKHSWVVAPCEYCCGFPTWPPGAPKATKAPTAPANASGTPAPTAQPCNDAGFPQFRPPYGCCPESEPKGGWKKHCGVFKHPGDFDPNANKPDPARLAGCYNKDRGDCYCKPLAGDRAPYCT